MNNPDAIRCAPNFRDVAQAVPLLRPGLLYRSELVADADEADAEMLRRCGIRLVVDLRGPGERAAEPNRWWMQNGVEIAEFDVARRDERGKGASPHARDFSVDGVHRMMEQAYRTFPEGAAGPLRFLAERIEVGIVPVVVHCRAGKDRTGVTIAMLLAAVGIGRDAIHADYLASRGRIHQRTIAATRTLMEQALRQPVAADALERLSGVHGDYLDSAFAAAEAAHGSVSAYLEQAGIDAPRRARLREILLRD